MNESEKKLWERAKVARAEGKSIRIEEPERASAKKLVDKELLFWCIDYDHVMPYE